MFATGDQLFFFFLLDSLIFLFPILLFICFFFLVRDVPSFFPPRASCLVYLCVNYIIRCSIHVLPAHE